MSNKNDENNRILLATILSTILIVVWMRWYGGRTLPKMEEEKIIKINKEGEVKTKEEKVSEVVEYPTMEEEKYEDKRIKIDTKTLHGTINLRGLVFDDLILKKYKKSIEGGENYNLLNGRNDNDAYYVNVGWDGKDIDIPDKNTLWVADKDTLRSNEPLTFTYNSEGGVLYKVIIEVDDNYMFKITQTVQNKSENVLSIKSKNSISKKQQRGTDDVGVHSGFIGVIDKQIEELEYNKLGKNVVVFDNGNHWSGWTDKYWLVSFVSNFEYRVYKDDDMLFIVDFVDNNTDVAPDTEYATSSYLYAGAKDLNLLDSYADKFDILYFDKAVDFGWYYFITKPLYLLLKLFYDFVGNLGISILLLTILVRACMYPVTAKSFVSTAKIKQIQPRINELKKNYKDKALLTQKTMELYKRENINPMSGCLPSLLQIPIFFSLYKVLSISIDMRHATFLGIKDLADKDYTTIWNLFGLLPYKVNFLQIGFLPILLSLTTWLQFNVGKGKNDQDDEMSSTTKYMPIVFLFIFNKMPCGLLIYWIFSNVISIVQQIWIEKRIKKK